MIPHHNRHADASSAPGRRFAAVAVKCCIISRSRKGTAARAQLRADSASNINRRIALTYFGAAGSLLACPPALCKVLSADIGALNTSSSSPEQCWAQLGSLPPGVAYARQGPLLPLELPKLEHTCTSCFPACVGDKCLLNIEVTYPKGGSLLGLTPPYPLAIFSGGFTISCASYKSTAARLASWGYTVVRYNTRDALPDVLDDVTCVKLLRELIDWAASHPLMRRLADTRRVYATGHSRGAKLAALTAAADPRVAALFLMDPVDVTQYAPLSDRFPSAAAALSAVAQSGRFLPVAVVGSGQAGDCAPRFNNYRRFFQAAPSAAWEVLLPAAGHFQYLDSSTALQRAVCGGSPAAPDDTTVRGISQAALVAWGEAMIKLPGTDVLSCLEARCRSFAQPPGGASSSSSSGKNGSVSGNSKSNSGDSSSSTAGWLPPPADLPVMALHARQQQQPSTPSNIYSNAQDDERNSRQTDLQQQIPKLNAPNASRSISLGDDTQVRALQGGTAEHHQSAQLAGLPQSRTSFQQQQQQQSHQSPDALPQVQTRQDMWSAGCAPSPVRLRQLQVDLDRLLVVVSYQSAATVEVHSQFKNFA